MISVNLKKLTKVSLVTVILGSMILGYFCINTFNHKMDIEITDNTSSVIKSMESCCGANFTKHLESLRTNFTLPLKASNYLITFLALIALIFVISRYFRKSVVHISFLYKLYLRQRPDLFAFDHLRLAFRLRKLV